MKCEDLFLNVEIPEVLGNRELLQYFEKYKSGDQSAREMIIKHNIKIVMYVVLKKFANTSYALEDLASIGLIGLIKSVNTIDLSKKIQFSTYAYRCINNEILMFIKKDKKHLNKCSLNDTLCIDKIGNELKIEEILYDSNSDLASDCEYREKFVILCKVIKNLSERDRKIVELYFGLIDGVRIHQTEIAGMLNVSQSLVAKRLKEVLLIFREEMEIKGYLSDSNKSSLENIKLSKTDEGLDSKLGIDSTNDEVVNLSLIHI